ncbi:uncharacterized protein [Lepeophtheirus salmonis]|uniref:uncharacterized protein n=1 Tax=Lepeophtheirus salmonis TaxID=72036 RepID=UPI001AE8A603|nr:RNA demethylase ALKBH5-like [Lepeophtheirus salmonis]
MRRRRYRSGYSSEDSSSPHPNRRRDGSEDRIREKVRAGVKTHKLYDGDACRRIENEIEKVVLKAERGDYKPCTVDRSPLRIKYFFGEGYVYGNQMERRGPGNERLYPKGEVDPIPSWIHDYIERPMVKAGIIREGFVNSAVINIYLPGGCIVSHIDPPQIFDRPIVTASFLSESALSFGCRFNFRPMRISHPILRVPIGRGTVLSMEGFAADGITHCIRPEDVRHRRAVVILRHVPESAPRLTHSELLRMRRNGALPNHSINRSSSRSTRSRSFSGSSSYSSSGSSSSSDSSSSNSSDDSSSRSPSPKRKRGKKEASSSSARRKRRSKSSSSSSSDSSDTDSSHDRSRKSKSSKGVYVRRDTKNKTPKNDSLKRSRYDRDISPSSKEKAELRRLSARPDDDEEIKKQLEEYNKVLDEIESLEKNLVIDGTSAKMGDKKKPLEDNGKHTTDKKKVVRKEGKREREKRLRQQLKARLRRDRILKEKLRLKRERKKLLSPTKSTSNNESASSKPPRKRVSSSSSSYSVLSDISLPDYISNQNCEPNAQSKEKTVLRSKNVPTTITISD